MFQWGLCLPHLLHTGVLATLSALAWVPMALSVLVSGRVPSRLAGLQALALRERVRTYSYFFVLRESYPPHPMAPSLADPGDDESSDVSFEVPLRVPRSAAFRSVAMVPHALVLAPIGLVMDLGYPLWMLVAVRNGGWPEWAERSLVRVERWVVGVVAYVGFLRDEPPPFGLAANDPAVGGDRTAVMSGGAII